MAGFIYLGSDDPGENSVCEVFGYAFPKGETVEVKEPDVIKALTTNPMFDAAPKGPIAPALKADA